MKAIKPNSWPWVLLKVKIDPEERSAPITGTILTCYPCLICSPGYYQPTGPVLELPIIVLVPRMILLRNELFQVCYLYRRSTIFISVPSFGRSKAHHIDERCIVL